MGNKYSKGIERLRNFLLLSPKTFSASKDFKFFTDFESLVYLSLLAISLSVCANGTKHNARFVVILLLLFIFPQFRHNGKLPCMVNENRFDNGGLKDRRIEPGFSPRKPLSFYTLFFLPAIHSTYCSVFMLVFLCAEDSAATPHRR